MPMFKGLNHNEIIAYKQWARENYTPLEPIKGIWHPVIQAECVAMNAEAGKTFDVETELKRILDHGDSLCP